MNKKPKTIIVGMSGGVDSSVAALLLKQQGYQVEGLFMKNWEDDDDGEFCSAAEDLSMAEAVCDIIGIPLHTVNFAKQYWELVFEDFLQELKEGRTPNPDILCNREIKFKTFLEYALSLGADKIATGHYANNLNKNSEQGYAHDDEHGYQHGYQLLKAKDLSKDQSYFLYSLSQKALRHSLFPLGGLLKTEVRALAEAAGLPNHQRKDSTGICFIGERPFKDFLSRYIKNEPGPIMTAENQMLGEHQGLMYYTIGQRQGLGIGGKTNAKEAPWYVVKKDQKQNTLIVAQNEYPYLYRDHLEAMACHWITEEPKASEFQCQAKIRYRQADQPCRVKMSENAMNAIEVYFEEPQRAITPGQSVVFYDNNVCLGGGIIR